MFTLKLICKNSLTKLYKSTSEEVGTEIPNSHTPKSHQNTHTHTPAVRQNVTNKDQLATAFPTLGAVTMLLLCETLVKSSLQYILN